MKTIDPSNTDIKHSFSRTIAKKYKENGALVFGYLSYKIHHSKNERGGKMWYYGTIDEIARQFPYLQRSAVYAAIKRLTRPDGLLTTGNYNKKRYDRTLWYAFKTKEASQIAEKGLVYFKVEDAYNLDVAKAVLLSNLRYWINESKKKEPEYIMHPMSPTDLARILPFSRATIQRKLNELVYVDGELVCLTNLEKADLREPTKYGFLGEVAFRHDIEVSPQPVHENANKSTHLAAQIQIPNMAGSIPNMATSNPNAEGSNPNDYTTLEFHLKEPIEKKLLETSQPVLRPGCDSDSLSFSGAAKESRTDIKKLLAEFKDFVTESRPLVKSYPIMAGSVQETRLSSTPASVPVSPTNRVPALHN